MATLPFKVLPVPPMRVHACGRSSNACDGYSDLQWIARAPHACACVRPCTASHGRTPEGVVVPKVLILQQHVWLPRLERCHELGDKLVVGVISGAPLAQTLVRGVGQQVLVVGAHVQADGQARVGVNTWGKGGRRMSISEGRGGGEALVNRPIIRGEEEGRRALGNGPARGTPSLAQALTGASTYQLRRCRA